MATIQDKALFDQIKQGDEHALQLLFHMYYSSLCQYANTLLKDTAAAEDVVQQCYTTLWVKRLEIDIEGAVKSYLYSAVRNASFNVIKHQKVRQTHRENILHTTNGHSPDGSEVLEANELQARIKIAIGQLPPQCGIIFTKSRYESMSYQEIADEMGISVKTVDNQMGKALRLMREALRDFLPILIAIGFLPG